MTPKQIDQIIKERADYAVENVRLKARLDCAENERKRLELQIARLIARTS